MTDAPTTVQSASQAVRREGIRIAVERRIARRRRAELRFRIYGIVAILFGLSMLAVLLISLIFQGYSAFVQTHIRLEITFSADDIDPDGKRTADALRDGNYQALIKRALRKQFPAVRKRKEKRHLYKVISSNADLKLREMVQADPSLIGKTRQVWLLAQSNIDLLEKGKRTYRPDEENVIIKRVQYDAYVALKKAGQVATHFNWGFFTRSNSAEPESAGIWGALVGSFWTMLVTLLIAFPIGVATAVYLEEFAPRNWVTDLIEVNINNLAAVPSIVFGLLGLAVLISFMDLPRSTPLVGGMVLALMTLPRIIIPARAALTAVPPSVREAALGVGASRMQTVTHHVLPLAMPGILTGTIIGMAQALGETAPLLMVGLTAFVAEAPGGITDGTAVMPTQIFLWAGEAERGFEEKTAAAILVLLAFLVLMNAVAIFLRKKFERRW